MKRKYRFQGPRGKKGKQGANGYTGIPVSKKNIFNKVDTFI